MRSFAFLMATMIVMAAGLPACGGGGDNPPDGAPLPDTPGVPDAEQPDTYVMPGDGNDSFNDAVDLTIDGPGVDEGIRSPGDHDFYRFTGTAGQ